MNRDEVVAKRVAEDPLCWHGGFKAQHSNMLIKATDVLAKENCLKKITAPLLIMQGGQDKLVCPDGAPFLHDNVGSVDKKLLMYEDAFHNLFVELEDVKTTVIKETCSWIDQHSS
jgi:alpha-beta hydrolase superfamily lysophospholipase